jgi:uncharacterized membrane protein YqjE
MTDLIRNGQAARSDQSTADLVKQAADQISRLVRDELRLAQAELTRKGKQAGVGVGMFGAAGIVALYGVTGLLAALVIGLAVVMPAWLAALLVGVVLLAVAGVLAMVGRDRVRDATPPVPEETARSVKADVEAVTDAVKNRGRR